MKKIPIKVLLNARYVVNRHIEFDDIGVIDSHSGKLIGSFKSYVNEYEHENSMNDEVCRKLNDEDLKYLYDILDYCKDVCILDDGNLGTIAQSFINMKIVFRRNNK